MSPYRDTFEATKLPCPRCDRALLATRIGGVPIEECSSGCLGLFVGAAAIRQIIDEHEHGFADALLAELPRRPIRIVPRAGERMYIKCPHCAELMARRQFATGAGVVVDVCKPHGTFFDCGELPVVIEFVMAGGLAEAAAKDAARKQQEERERRDNRRHAELMAQRSASYPHRFGAFGARISSGSPQGDALVELLAALIGS